MRRAAAGRRFKTAAAPSLQSGTRPAESHWPRGREGAGSRTIREPGDLSGRAPAHRSSREDPEHGLIGLRPRGRAQREEPLRRLRSRALTPCRLRRDSARRRRGHGTPDRAPPGRASSPLEDHRGTVRSRPAPRRARGRVRRARRGLPDALGLEPPAARRRRRPDRRRGRRARHADRPPRLAALAGGAPRVERPHIFTFAADHGVVAEGVSAYPQIVTVQMVETFLRGGAAVNVLARQAEARVIVADFGVANPIPASPGLHSCPIAPGTANLARGPAMTRAQALQALETGARLAEQALDAGADLLATGEMGIGNTTAASAIAAAITGAGPERVTGRGTGVDDATLARKVDVVRRALAVNVPDARDGLDVLAKVGGFEIAGLVGVILAGAARRLPVVLDGFISGAAALVAVTLAPDARHARFAAL